MIYLWRDNPRSRRLVLWLTDVLHRVVLNQSLELCRTKDRLQQCIDRLPRPIAADLGEDMLQQGGLHIGDLHGRWDLRQDMACEKALIGGERRSLEFVHVAFHGKELVGEAVERLDLQEVRDVRVHDTTTLCLEFLQRVGVEITPYLLARDRILKDDT